MSKQNQSLSLPEGRERGSTVEWECNSDDLVSIMLSVICESGVSNLAAHCVQLTNFYDLLNDIGGEDSYVITNFAVAIEYMIANDRGSNAPYQQHCP